MYGLDKVTIDNLIACEKKIIDPPKKDYIRKNRHYRNDMKLISTDEAYDFSVFFRYSEEFTQDFSIGIKYIGKQGKSYVIFRCNGPHGETVLNKISGNPHHFLLHTHTLEPDTGTVMRPESTDEYATFQDAIAYFIKRCNIIEAEQYFPFLNNAAKHQHELGF
jgi:hypothetical protein